MSFDLEQSWREVFALAAQAKAAKQREEHMQLFYQDLDRQQDHKHKIEEKEKKEAKDLEDKLVTAAQLAAFDQHLDAYDTSTVHALMENREALDKVSDDLRKMEENAYVLPDGRRIFKTTDGHRVFDEHGGEVPASTINPQMIDDRHTSWESYKAGKDTETRLEGERHELLDFQAKVDAARDRAGKGDITKKELDGLDADLKASAPPAVRQKLGLAPLDADAKTTLDPDRLSPAWQGTPIDGLPRRAQPQPQPAPM